MKFVSFFNGDSPLSTKTINCKRIYDFKNSICVEADGKFYCFKWEELGYFRIYD